MQMGEVAKDGGCGLSVTSIPIRRKGGNAQLAGQMSIEEIRINKQLLKEISRRKKDRAGTYNDSIVSQS